LWGHGAQKVIFESQENGFITIKLFEKWVGAVLTPYFSAVRMHTGYNGPAILILDGCTHHAIEGIQVGLRAKRIYLAPLHPHSSDQTQPLDFGVFATVKRFSLSPMTGVSSRQSSQAMRIFDS
jgi:hypothetical protein